MAMPDEVRRAALTVDWYAVLRIPPKPSGDAAERMWRWRNYGRLMAVAEGCNEEELAIMREALKEALP